MSDFELLLLQCREYGLDISCFYNANLAQLALEELGAMEIEIPERFKGKYLRYALLYPQDTSEQILNRIGGETKPINPLPVSLFTVENSPSDYGIEEESKFSPSFYDSLEPEIIVDQMYYRYPDSPDKNTMAYLDENNLPDHEICRDLLEEGINVSRWTDEYLQTGNDLFAVLQDYGERRFLSGPTTFPILEYDPDYELEDYRRQLSSQLLGKTLREWIGSKHVL